MSRKLENLPLFPIGVIIFPGEIQPLHIFEPRYKQLINEVRESGELFGIPFVKNGKMCEFGSGVVLHKILAVSPTGEMDILVRGVNLFRIVDIVEQLPDKLYAGGSVYIMEEMNKKVVPALLEKYKIYREQLRKINKESDKKTELRVPHHVFDIAGQLPLELDEKYRLIRFENCVLRENFLIRKLDLLMMINNKVQEIGYRFYLN